MNSGKRLWIATALLLAGSHCKTRDDLPPVAPPPPANEDAAPEAKAPPLEPPVPAPSADVTWRVTQVETWNDERGGPITRVDAVVAVDGAEQVLKGGETMGGCKTAEAAPDEVARLRCYHAGGGHFFTLRRGDAKLELFAQEFAEPHPDRTTEDPAPVQRAQMELPAQAGLTVAPYPAEERRAE